MFTWKAIYKELALTILAYEDRQSELVACLAEMKSRGLKVVNLQDENEMGEKAELSVMDPFTFFANFNRALTNDNRIAILSFIKNWFSLKSPIPEDFNALPVVDMQRSWFFPYSHKRRDQDVKLLWNLARQLVEAPDTIDADLFDDALNIYTVAIAKLTQGMFWMAPEVIISTDSRNCKFLKDRYGITKPDASWEAYNNFLNQVNEKVGTDYVEISHNAWKATSQDTNSQQESVATLEVIYKTFLVDKDCQNRVNKFKELTNQLSLIEDLSQLPSGHEVINSLWFVKDNGIGEVLKNHHPQLNKLKDILPEISQAATQINNLDEFIDLMALFDEKTKDEIGFKMHAHLYRLCASLHPGKFLLFRQELLKKWMNYLNGNYRAGLKLSTNWYELNNELMTWLDSKLPELDSIERSIFAHFFYNLKPKKDNTQQFKVEGGDLDRFKDTQNKILYGPPGTGKTFNTVNLAVELCDGERPEARTAVKERYEELIEAGQIVFTTFHQSMSYEDFVEGIKPETTSDNDVIYDVKPGLFHRIAEKAETNWENSKSEVSAGFDSVWAEFIRPLEEGEAKEISVKTARGEFKIYEVTDRTIRFEKQNGSRLHTLSIKTLKKFYSNPEALEAMGGLQTYYRGLLDTLKVDKKTASKEELKNYVLVIDEINRGNVSAIFGELITLLEDDKRLGEDELKVRLPYSKEEFGVPPNLYIIGTMNTADRSVEALDTALRRRFSFTEMMPNPGLLGPVAGIELKAMLTKINERLEVLIGRDHTIGHAFFMKVKNLSDLQVAFRDKVIPQLQEYFYGDWEKIQLVLGKPFVESRKSGSNIFAVRNYDDYEERRLWSITPFGSWDAAAFRSIYAGQKKEQEENPEEETE